MANLYRHSLASGVKVRDRHESFVVVEVLNASEVVVEDSAGRRRSHLAAELVIDMPELAPPRQIDLEAIPEAQWQRASEIADALRPLIEKGPYRRTAEEVQAVADRLFTHRATVYRWIKEYELTGKISSLLRKPRSDKGKRRLPEEVEKIIQDGISELYLTTQRRSIAKTAEEIQRRAKIQGLQPPDENTIRARILDIDEVTRVRRRDGYKAADERFSPNLSGFPDADFQLAVVQIDHTPMDVIVVDDVHRKPIGRAYLTIAIDVYSKVCMGFYLSLDHPGTLATGLCIAHSILAKETWLREMELDDYEWPCWGLMRAIHTDNAKEFRGTMLGKSAKEYGILAQRRPKGRPKYGGHVERAFRTYMQEVHNELPGTTRSNPRDRGEYDAEGNAVMTMDALEQWFTMFIVGYYHQKPHEGNAGLAPVVKWERGILGEPGGMARGIPARFKDEDRLRLDFMPYVERTVQEYGIQIEGVNYWSDAIRRLIHSRSDSSVKMKKQFICRYDPRNMSKVWLYEPESEEYIEISYRDISRPRVSLWEIRAAKKALREDSRTSTNEELIFRTIERMRALVQSESGKTKSARRMQQRQKAWEKKVKGKPNVPDTKKVLVEKGPVPSNLADEDFHGFEPFSGIREA